MPWDGRSFAGRHNHSLHGEKADHAARIANAVLKSGAPEGESIAIANKWAQRHRRADGGYSPDNPQTTREYDAQVLSRGRPQSPQTDLNMTQPPDLGAPSGFIPSSHVRSMSTMPPPSRFHFPTPPQGPQRTAYGGGIRRADGGYSPPPPPPHLTRQPQSIQTRPSPSWLPGPIPNDDFATQWRHDAEQGQRAAYGGAIPRRAPGGTAPGLGPMQTAAPNVNAQGFVPVPQSGTINLDLSNGALNQSSLPGLQGIAERGLTISGGGPQSPATAAAHYYADVAAARAGQPFPYPAAVGGAIPRRAGGGPAPMSMGMPSWSRMQARGEESHPSGLIPGMGGGRQDNIAMNLAPHSHVIPADVVSGWGHGNPEQGAANIGHAMQTGPFGTGMPKVPTHATRGMTPRMPHLARGGNANGVRTLVSPKEMIISPADVARIGGGDYDKGHDWLDRFIVHSRKQIVAHMRALPPPVKE